MIACRRASACCFHCASLRRLMQHAGKVGQVALVFVEQAVQADGSIMMRRTAKGVEAKRDVEARLAHGAVALIEVAGKAIAMGLREAADDGMGRIATGFGELSLLRRGG